MIEENQSVRSRTMRAIKAKDTAPELSVRHLVHSLGYRYRLHCGDLPGKPDLVFPGRKKIIFVNGCFWHSHNCRRGARLPKSNQAYWKKKLQRNKERDKTNLSKLRKMGWKILTIWECQVKKATLEGKITKFLDS